MIKAIQTWACCQACKKAAPESSWATGSGERAQKKAIDGALRAGFRLQARPEGPRLVCETCSGGDLALWAEKLGVPGGFQALGELVKAAS